MKEGRREESEGEEGLGVTSCSVLNVAAGKAPMQSSVAEGGIPQKAVDGSSSTSFTTDTCTLTAQERQPWWYVNLLEPYMVQLVRLDFGRSCCAEDQPAVVVVRVGNNRPDLDSNPICNRFIGLLKEGRPLFLPCNPPMPGAFVSVHIEGPPGVQLSICEAFVYTDQALPIERCPSFRDQPPGSTATYNGKCYIFYNQQPKTFDQALEFCRSRGGSLVDETNPALQGFLSWELWRKHRGDSSGQYWMGAVRDPEDPNNWKWINGRDVSVSFWNLPGGNENCARFDGTKGWLWSDTNCNAGLNFICQHRPQTCGKPEQPPNSTMVGNTFSVGSMVEYRCDPGHTLVGPAQRSCLESGFFNEFPPTCRSFDAQARRRYWFSYQLPLSKLRNYYVYHENHLHYSCSHVKSPPCHSSQIYFSSISKNTFASNVDILCSSSDLECGLPAPIRHGSYSLINGTRYYLSQVKYECDPGYTTIGRAELVCDLDERWNGPPPLCHRE
ncbi:Fucolectin-5 [Portunus trituberculatus]|uniref:Fucolectin-5 n=1 Tax=Portunus trituberculatus TaxID=210409 RepID=A0A5B7DN51_PORTR|nr:Fucolectin-5 [Portunus trituberculatus]